MKRKQKETDEKRKKEKKLTMKTLSELNDKLEKQQSVIDQLKKAPTIPSSTTSSTSSSSSSSQGTPHRDPAGQIGGGANVSLKQQGQVNPSLSNPQSKEQPSKSVITLLSSLPSDKSMLVDKTLVTAVLAELLSTTKKVRFAESVAEQKRKQKQGKKIVQEILNGDIQAE